MCLLIVNPARLELPVEVLEQAAWSNPDGFGAAWSADGRIVTSKSAGQSQRSFCRFADIVDANRPQIVHFRMATHGEVCKRLSHPFAGRGWAMAHNGILPVDAPHGESDTSYLVSLLRTMPSVRPAFPMLSELCGRSNKLGFVFRDGTTEIIGENRGTWIDGIWYSNGSGHESRWKGWCNSGNSGRLELVSEHSGL